MPTTQRLTHYDRKLRRKAMADAVRKGDSVLDVAEQYGVTVETVAKAAFEHRVKHLSYAGIANGRRPDWFVSPQTIVSKEEWLALDWSKRDVDIAREVGVCRERVRQKRREFGKPQSPDHHKSRIGIETKQWLVSVREDVGGMVAGDVAAMCPTGATATSIKRIANNLGIRLVGRRRIGADITKENLKDLVDVNAESGCWEFTCAPSRASYMSIGAEYAHRFVFKLFYGDPPDGKWVLHRCDNRKCINPEHLYAGTALDNAHDRARNGKWPAKHLSPDQVREIRQLHLLGSSVRSIAERFKVDYVTIRSVVTGRTHKNVQDASVALTSATTREKCGVRHED